MSQMPTATAIYVQIDRPENRVFLESLAERHNWAILRGEIFLAEGFVLEMSNDRLQLRDLSLKRTKPICVDFLSERQFYKQRFQQMRNHPFGKALGLKRNQVKTVVDATLGLGEDAFIMAALGCQVLGVERSQVIFELVADGLRRAQHDDEISLWIENRISIRLADSRRFLLDLDELNRPEVIYLDPMFTGVEKKSALPKKEMQILRHLLGPDIDAKDLLNASLQRAQERVIVKRAVDAEPIAGNVSHSFAGKTTRYDVYLVHRS